jgi:hypothetical protein
MSRLRLLLLPAAAAASVVVLLGLVAPGAFASRGSTPRAGATGATGATGNAPGLVASVSACHADPLTANRYAIFASQMTTVADTSSMSVNFVLEERAGRSPTFAPVNAPGFGVWIRSQAGVGIFTYSHEVTGLPAPASFRVLVHARWLDRHHRVLHREMIVSPVCAQPLLQPDLAIGAPLTHAADTQPGTFVYSVVVRNEGTAAAGAFEVGLSVNGTALPNVAVTTLAADSTQLVQFTGPRCTAGSSLVASADATGAVTEPANADRTRTFTCP